MTRLNKPKIQICPTPEEISNARTVFSDWSLHYYQLLYHHPYKYGKLVGSQYGQTSPFSIKRDSDNYHIGLKLIYNGNPDYSFNIDSFRQRKTQEDYDNWIIEMCELIIQSHQENKQKKDKRMCCPLAEQQPCVCVISYKCILHGGQCIGSHD